MTDAIVGRVRSIGVRFRLHRCLEPLDIRRRQLWAQNQCELPAVTTFRVDICSVSSICSRCVATYRSRIDRRFATGFIDVINRYELLENRIPAEEI